jgi:hypothetical protein
VVSKSSLMSEIITFIFEPAKLQINCARANGASTRRSDFDGAAFDEFWSTISPASDRPS